MLSIQHSDVVFAKVERDLRQTSHQTGSCGFPFIDDKKPLQISIPVWIEETRFTMQNNNQLRQCFDTPVQVTPVKQRITISCSYQTASRLY